ncbi:unnamed protein product [Didymodactylos carnosus]|uniref:Uncharacterized protein n=1 Tax=Didymodactylos carnosus TaxID=1234261 RepID=A0A814W2U2_9BILA|nr:unnamed protein product [Didymodactylos carnosus]CAF1324131.1 unnamed protein product [Didymodactylos carnosus]CAF3961264.1 unnamed protein product [Didymodactylos carnosus]CAF4134718.1 unnamed protein product [Didymodactylos carnosus]
MEYLFPESLNNIWSISTLTHCNLNGIQRSERWIPKISSISTSIEYISLEHSVFEMPSLSHLFHCTPHLKSLSLFASSTYSDVPMDCVIPSMKSLKIHYETLIDSLQYIFQTMPNLRHLTIDTRRMYFDGYEWEQIITNYLPKLKIFRLKMDLSPEMHMNIMTKNVDELLLTYRTTFWLEEHRWFIQCDYDSESLQPIMVYTLPYAFHNYRYSNKHCSKSTCPNEENYWSYDSVETISRNNNEKTLFNAYILRHPRFPSIRHLEIRLPLDDCFSLLFPSLNRLTSLNVDYFNDVSYSQLQMLIDQAPFLYSLKLDPRQRLHSQLFQLTSKSIRRLDIKFNPSAYSYKFSAEDCMNLINSPLGFQCEVLYIDVSSRNGALDLIYKMPNLRLLVFKSEDDQFFKNSSFLPTNDELAQWLRDHLPSSYTTFRDPRSFETRVWIDRQNRKHVLPSNDGVTTTWQNKFSGFLSTIKQFFS